MITDDIPPIDPDEASNSANALHGSVDMSPVDALGWRVEQRPQDFSGSSLVEYYTVKDGDDRPIPPPPLLFVPPDAEFNVTYHPGRITVTWTLLGSTR